LVEIQEIQMELINEVRGRRYNEAAKINIWRLSIRIVLPGYSAWWRRGGCAAAMERTTSFKTVHGIVLHENEDMLALGKKMGVYQQKRARHRRQ
jgi:hypothetical protein